jgi:hypothetical protein
MLFIGAGTVLSLLVGCATSGSVTPARTPDAAAIAQASVRENATDRMFHWREEARELHEMADHREREADLLARGEHGPAQEEDAAHLRTLAKQLHAAADYADEQAREAQREIPHGMMQ